MEESMQVSSSQERGKLWPVVFSLLAKPLPPKPAWLLSMVPSTPQKPSLSSSTKVVSLATELEELLDELGSEELLDDSLEDELPIVPVAL